MKSSFRFLSVASATMAVSLAAAEGWFLEAGAGYAVFTGGDYSLTSVAPPNPSANANGGPTTLVGPVFTEDDRAAVGSLSGGYRFADWFSLRLAYQHFGRTTSTSLADVVITATNTPSGMIRMDFSGDVQVVSLSPEFRWQAAPRFSVSVAPQLHWVFSEATLRTTTDSPLIQIVPFISYSTDELSLGGSVGAEYAVSDRLDLTLRYQYVDLDPSWDREAHVWSAGLKWEF